MRFDRIIPTDRLKPYIQYFIIAENKGENSYKVFPSTGLVAGFQYQGQLTTVQLNGEVLLAPAGITGISDCFKQFRSSANTGTILVYFTEAGFAHFTSHPANGLFNQSISLEHIFEKSKVTEMVGRLAFAATNTQRIGIVEQFLVSQLRDVRADRLVIEAIRLINHSRGVIRIRELANNLLISQSPLEKRFRKIVGTTPKKFASIVRFNAVLNQLRSTTTSLTAVGYENRFFDQAHFIRDFKQYTGDTPEHFKRLL